MRPTHRLIPSRPFGPDVPSPYDGEGPEYLAPVGDYLRERKTVTRRVFEPQPMQSARVLVVEDDLYTRRVLRMLLARPSLSLVEATNGEAAIDMLSMHPCDLVLLDFTLPGMSSMDTLAWIRRSPTPWADIPILGLADANEPVPLGPLRALNLTEWTTKPLSRSDLTAKLLALMPGLGDVGL